MKTKFGKGGKLKDKVAIITGSSQNLGREIALLFSLEGARVVLVGRNGDKGNKIKKEIEKNGGEAIFVKCDVTKVEDVKDLIRQTIKEFKKIDILVNNVGYGRLSKITDMEIEDWNEVINATLNSAFYCSKFALQEMIKNKDGGVIVNISSISGLIGDYGFPSYNAGKAGMINLTRSIALDYAVYNIRANALCPGRIESTGQGQTENTAILEDEAVTKHQFETIPMGRKCKPIEVAKAALFLASDDSSYITATTLVVDGGLLGYSGMGKISQL